MLQYIQNQLLRKREKEQNSVKLFKNGLALFIYEYKL